PGYDRHFGICEHMGIEMINVPMTPHGPNMDLVEQLVAGDEDIKGIWCVPKYQNPTGITYSEETVRRLATMKVAAEDFRIFWDNAYVVHDLYPEGDTLANIMTIAKEAGTQDRIYQFTSTSKITFPGAGVSCIAASEKNIKDILSHMKYQTIGANKINQYAHLQYLKSAENIKELMTKHADIIRPKFEKFMEVMGEAFGDDSGIATWTRPKGGYFVSLDVLPGCAKEVGRLCKSVGLTITNVGDTYPYGVDDKDSNIRIAPTFTTDEDLETALQILVCCIKVACLTKLSN
ncbi:MAG: aminotransferase class I/II-fold pyridoxal phosphate-dependent enzyme, partial [Clostridia bacterium]|nr:aminotransferase class I/II-fold pyridoxal phosphate-dependent enzyme [Clostridia bacterium]